MAYAAVVSLKHTIESVLRSSESKIVLPRSEIEFISVELAYSQSFLEAIKLLPSSSNTVDAPSERRVTDAAKKFQDLIDSHISDLFLSGSDQSSTNDRSLISELSRHLLIVRQEITSFTQTLKKTDDDHYQQPMSEGDSSDYKHGPLIRHDYDGGRLREELRRWIIYGRSHLNVMLIYGMAGIGKTTLVGEVFCDPDVQNYFDIYSFVSMGGQYQLKEILVLILRRMPGLTETEAISLNNKSEDYLLWRLYYALLGNKYLIVLDNMWNTQVWDRLKPMFSDSENGSRIILTSTLSDFNRDGVSLMEVPLLNDDESWNLLRKLVFTPDEQCSRQLEKVGRKIAKNCEGLPLAIIEVGKLLCKIDKTVEEWIKIAESDDHNRWQHTSITVNILELQDVASISEGTLSVYGRVPKILRDHPLETCRIMGF